MLNLKDAAFILKLVNEPAWIKNIGDKNVHNINDAEHYFQQGPLKSYHKHGFGLYLVKLKTKNKLVGICGLIQREELDQPDIGYALMSDFWGMGLASEAAKGALQYAQTALGIQQVFGMTSVDNTRSIRVLEKVGLKFEKMIELPGYDEPSRLFTST